MPPRVEGQLSDALIAGFEDGVIGVDRVGGIRIFNKAAAGIFSLDPREVLGRSIWDALPKSEFSRTFIAQVKDSDPQPVQRLMLFPPDRMYAVRMQAVRSEHGRNLGAYAVLRKRRTNVHPSLLSFSASRVFAALLSYRFGWKKWGQLSTNKKHLP